MTEQEDYAAETRRRVWVTLAYVMAGTLVAGITVKAFTVILGHPLDATETEYANLPSWQLLVILAVTQLFSYLIPAFLAARLLFPGAWLRGLRLRPAPTVGKVAVGVAIFIATIGFTGYLVQLNLSFDLADWQAEIEGGVAELFENLILSSSTPVFLIVLFTVTVLPAAGEEMIFRGLIQPAFIRMTGSSHVGIWLTAAFFGLVHLQFAGMLPRIFLGAVLGFLAYESQRLWIPIVAHALFNGAQVVAARFGALAVAAEASEEAAKHPNVLWGLASAVLAAYALHLGLPYIRPAVGELHADDDLASSPWVDDPEA